MKTLLKIFYSHYSKINSGDWPWIRTRGSFFVSFFIVILFLLSILKFFGIVINLDLMFEHKIILIFIGFLFFYAFDYLCPERLIKDYKIKNSTLEKNGFLIVTIILGILFILITLLLSSNTW